jgi:hypothetical protein
LLCLDIELAATKRLSKKHKKTKAKALLSILQTGKLFGDDSKDVLEGYVKQSTKTFSVHGKYRRQLILAQLAG